MTIPDLYIGGCYNGVVKESRSIIESIPFSLTPSLVGQWEDKKQILLKAILPALMYVCFKSNMLIGLFYFRHKSTSFLLYKKDHVDFPFISYIFVQRQSVWKWWVEKLALIVSY